MSAAVLQSTPGRRSKKLGPARSRLPYAYNLLTRSHSLRRLWRRLLRRAAFQASGSRPKRSVNQHRAQCKPQLQRCLLSWPARIDTLEYVLFLPNTALTPPSIRSGGLADPETLTQHSYSTAASPPPLADAANRHHSAAAPLSQRAPSPRESENTKDVTTTGPRPANKTR